MSVYKELMLFHIMEMTLKQIEGSVAEAEKAVPQRAVAVLAEVQKIICSCATSDFEKIDEIVSLFIKNGISTGDCHDF